MPSRRWQVTGAYRALTAALGPGIHHIVITAQPDDSPNALSARAVVEVPAGVTPAVPSGEFGDVLAEAIWGVPGEVIASTYGPSGSGTYAVRGWFIAAGWFHPMSAAELCNACLVTADGRWRGSGCGVSYEDGHLIPRPSGPDGSGQGAQLHPRRPDEPLGPLRENASAHRPVGRSHTEQTP
ncbi:hypothetical protein I2W78_00340 [Streptomyces spinoverrucosus]|uniref:hypothetical protein n=1 Tax=Streptomyces spinoverrucosus TaxID=284043 RepID=UPI0018C3B973|nr:hypothetical protein [Streptomyces spinoverrucosus]MBG0850358.1 hypothetical protein [Streptomyces spinoverrucosus]